VDRFGLRLRPDRHGFEPADKLTASNNAPNDHFGCSTSIHSDRALIGAYANDDACPTIPYCDSGSAYIFLRSGTTWTEQAKLTANDAAADSLFGNSVSLDGDVALVGAWGDDDGGDDVGSAYVFSRAGTVWSQEAKLQASDAAIGDMFGRAVSLAGDTAAIGAWRDDDTYPDSGSAYVFGRLWGSDATCNWYCGTGANAATDGYAITTPAVLGGSFEASVTGCAPGSTGAILVAHASPLTFAGRWGEVLVNIADPIGELMGIPVALGDPAAFVLPVPADPAYIGIAFYTQAASFGGGICLHCAYQCTMGF